MKYILLTLSLVSLCACTSKTEFGNCVGVGEDKKPNLEYKLSTWNIAMGVIFFEMVAPPILVVVGETYCPVGNK